MFISDFAIRRPIVTIVTMIALVVFGIAALMKLQTDEFPDIDAPIVFIGIAYPGASLTRSSARSSTGSRMRDVTRGRSATWRHSAEPAARPDPLSRPALPRVTRDRAHRITGGRLIAR